MNNSISIIEKSQLTMSRREIAELTGKKHKNVLSDIKNMFDALEIQSADFSADYKDSRGRTYQEYLLPKKYIECLLTGYSIPLRMKVIDRMHELENKVQSKIIVKNDKSGLVEYRKAKAIDLSVKALDRMFANLPHLSEVSKQAIYADTINPIAERIIVPLPILAEKTYSATEVGKMFGLSSNKIGRLAKEFGLKTDEYSVIVLDKSRSSEKQVENIRYKQKAIDVFTSRLATTH